MTTSLEQQSKPDYNAFRQHGASELRAQVVQLCNVLVSDGVSVEQRQLFCRHVRWLLAEVPHLGMETLLAGELKSVEGKDLLVQHINAYLIGSSYQAGTPLPHPDNKMEVFLACMQERMGKDYPFQDNSYDLKPVDSISSQRYTGTNAPVEQGVSVVAAQTTRLSPPPSPDKGEGRH